MQDIEADWFADERPSTAAEVLAILGPPDDIIYRHEHAGGLVQRKEIWGYGTNGHLTLATLGTVTIGLDDRVIDVTGGSVHPLPPGPTFAEPAVRSSLRDIHRLGREGRYDPFRGRSFHPREMIVLVNELRDLGKSSALGLLREYARINSSHHGLDGGAHVIAILRFLFEPPQDMLHPKTYLPFEEHKSVAYPAIPAAVIDGAPLILFPLGGYG
ncbi:MAG: hypothetical protein KJO43_02605, partial [Phycisphaerae bacterium]|nr:hypothetical protein [Phycisphaerae bacterium]